MTDSRATVVLATYDSRHEAEIARGIVEDAGLAAIVAADDAGGMRPILGRAQLLVAEADASSARAAMAEAGLLAQAETATCTEGLVSRRKEPGARRDVVAVLLLLGGMIFIGLAGFLWPSVSAKTPLILGVVALGFGALLMLLTRKPDGGRGQRRAFLNHRDRK